MSHTETGIFLQNVYTSMSKNFQLQSINSYHPMTPQNIDRLVGMEVNRLKASYISEEERYVDQMMLENPIVVERRATTATTIKSTSISSSGASSSNTSGGSHTQSLTDESDIAVQQQQRAEACRKSRINNKIKKAKLKYRHKFITKRLSHSANVLECIRDVIAKAETQLLCRGFNEEMLHQMRSNFGLETGKSRRPVLEMSTVATLTHTTTMMHND